MAPHEGDDRNAWRQLNDANGEIRQLEEDLRDASRKLEGLQRDSQEYEINCEREIAKLEYDVRVERRRTRGAWTDVVDWLIG